MQKSTFGKETEEPPAVVKKTVSKEKVVTSDVKPKSKPKTKTELVKPDVVLPADKVTFEAKVKEFSTKPNPFSDNDDEILLLENVRITEGEQIDVGQAWCGYSNTLKKLELVEGQRIEFAAKIVKKKHKEYPYKINNPSKLKVQ